MAPFYRFMTGAHQYRIEAASRDEALRYIIDQLQPADDTRAVITSTLYEENEGKQFATDSGEPPSDE